MGGYIILRQNGKLNQTIGGEGEGDWKQSLKENLRTKQSPYWQQYAWKISMQYFITPGVSSKYNDLSSGCWRSCTHILQNSNNNNKKIWTDVIHVIEKILTKSNIKKMQNIVLGIQQDICYLVKMSYTYLEF